MKSLEKAVKYVQVAPLQNLAGLLVTPLIFNCSKWVLENYNTHPKWATYMTIAALLNVGGIAVNQQIALENVREYKKVREAFEEYGWDERIVEPKSHSWCQRHATKIAAKDTGFGKEIRDYFNKK